MAQTQPTKDFSGYRPITLPRRGDDKTCSDGYWLVGGWLDGISDVSTGPWYVYQNGGCVNDPPVAENIASKADARLIAAAPQLLELARGTLSYLEDDSRSRRRQQAMLEATRAVIKRATDASHA